MAKGTSINDSVHGLVHMSAYEKSIISAPGFNRLHDVYQNSTVYLTFPSNRTKRYEHSIGTMKLSTDMFYYSLLNTGACELECFYDAAEAEVSGIMASLSSAGSPFQGGDYFSGLGELSFKSLDALEFDEVRRSFVPSNIPAEHRVTQVILMEAVRTAALLHDIGHPPFSHIVEFALRDVYIETDSKRRCGGRLTEREREFLAALDPCFSLNGNGRSRQLHECMGDMITENILFNNVSRDLPPAEQVFSALIYFCVLSIFEDKPFFSDLHRLMDATVDSDRLDYTTRDSINSGLDVGKIDYNRIIPDMRLHCDRSSGTLHFRFAFPVKAVSTIEDFLRRRFNLYKDIIFHHHVKKTDYLLQSAVRKFSSDYLLSEAPVTRAEAPQLLPNDISGLWHPLRPKERIERVKTQDNLVQWNDSWLMTMLKQIYYRDYYRTTDGCDDSYIISRQLSELLLNEKVYFSLTKRSMNFRAIDDSVMRSLGGAAAEYSGGFITRYFMSTMGADEFTGLSRHAVDSAATDVYGPGAVRDAIVAPVRLSAGIDPEKAAYFYSDATGSGLLTLDEISSIGSILSFELSHVPPFYLYVMFSSPEHNSPQMEHRFLGRVGELIAEGIKTDNYKQLSIDLIGGAS